jgi:hypothetical protein
MIAIDINSEMLPHLLERLSTLDSRIVQVRCHKILQKSLKDKLGSEGYVISCLVQRKDGSDAYPRFVELISIDDAENPDKHLELINRMRSQLDDYFTLDIAPAHLNIETNNLQKLVDRISKIPGVVQVRHHNFLKRKFTSVVGKDGMNVTAYVEDIVYDDAYIPFISALPKAVYDDLSKHDMVVADFRKRINDYLTTGIKPPAALRIEQMEIQTV